MCIGEICIELSVDLGTLLIAAVGGVATWLQHVHHQENFAQRRRLHHELMAQRGAEEKDLRASVTVARQLTERG